MDSFLLNTQIESPFHIKFRTEFFSKYYRSGRHRVRCFPKCCDSGHIFRGFCGEMVIAELNLRSDIDVESILVVGEICCISNGENLNYSRFAPDLEVNETDLRQRCYNEEDSLCLAQISANITQQQDANSGQIQSGYNNYTLYFRKKPWQFYPQSRMLSPKRLSFIFSVTVFTSTTISMLSSPSSITSKIANKPILQYMGIQTSQPFIMCTPGTRDDFRTAKSTDDNIQETMSTKPKINKRKIQSEEDIYKSISETKTKNSTMSPPKKRIRKDEHYPTSIDMLRSEWSSAQNNNGKELDNYAVRQFAEGFERESHHVHISSPKHMTNNTKYFVEDSVMISIDGERNDECLTSKIAKNEHIFGNNTISTKYFNPQELVFQPPLCLSRVFDNDDTDIESFQNNHTFDSIMYLGKKEEYLNRSGSQCDKRNSIFELFSDYKIRNIQCSPIYVDRSNLIIADKVKQWKNSYFEYLMRGTDELVVMSSQATIEAVDGEVNIN